jgi:formiminotetrahydrofolate cyclodeaminase
MTPEGCERLTKLKACICHKKQAIKDEKYIATNSISEKKQRVKEQNRLIWGLWKDRKCFNLIADITGLTKDAVETRIWRMKKGEIVL